ncbi:hypothetical protein BKA62DRAFT_690815 [Auriculariales sp. MPI-PUGE-AT-0066]|nr:hypothetical protein BKA62DRAFT_690815 [Auriculariales sp. MPI-PUGE-AT-0066]
MSGWSPAKSALDHVAEDVRSIIGDEDPETSPWLDVGAEIEAEPPPPESILSQVGEDLVAKSLVQQLRESREREATLRAQLSASQRHRKILRQRFEYLRSEAHVAHLDLNARLATAEKFLLLKEKELRDARWSGMDSGTDDQHLLACFDKLNEQITVFAKSLAEGLPAFDQQVRVDAVAIEQLEAANKPAYITVHFFLRMAVAGGATLGEIAVPLAKALICAMLVDHQLCDRLYSEICSRENQVVSARWRAMSYIALRPPELATDQQLIDNIVFTFFRALHAVFSSISRTSPTLTHDPRLWLDQRVPATTIALTALRWRDITSTSLVQKEYSGFTFWPLWRTDDKLIRAERLPFRAVQVHAGGAWRSQNKEKEDPQVVLLTTSLGLTAFRSSDMLGEHRLRRVVRQATAYVVQYSTVAGQVGFHPSEARGMLIQSGRPQSIRSVSSSKSWDSWASWWK